MGTAYFRENKRVSHKFSSKVPLKIERLDDFKSVVPQEGFIEIRQQFERRIEEDQIILSKNGVIIDHFNAL